MDYGAIISAAPNSIKSLGQVTLQVSPVHGFRFLRGQTYVTYRAPGATAQMTVRPAGVQHIDDYQIRAHVPDMAKGTYECLVTSGVDLARTAAPVQHLGMTSGGAQAARDYGIALDVPRPQSAYEGDTVSIRTLPGTGFQFHPSDNYLTFGVVGAQARFTLQPGGIRRVSVDEIRFELPPIPTGVYAIWVRSAGSDAQARMPIKHLGVRPFGQSRATGGQAAGWPGVLGMGPITGGGITFPGRRSFSLLQPLPAPGAAGLPGAFVPVLGRRVAGAMPTRGQRSPVARLNRRALNSGKVAKVNSTSVSAIPSAGSSSSAVGTTPFGPQDSGPKHDLAGVPPQDAYPDDFKMPPGVEPEEPIDPDPDALIPDLSAAEIGNAGDEPREAFPEPPDPYAQP